MTTHTELFGDSLRTHDGMTVQTAQVLADKDIVGIYFSAHYCPPCRKFTPTLTATYNHLKASGKNFEFVLVSSDTDANEFKDYFGGMPWLALPYEDSERREMLLTKFDLEGIPALVILNKDDKTITTAGVGAVSSDPQGANFPWTPLPVSPIALAGGITQQPSFVLLAEKSDKDIQTSLYTELTEIAKRVIQDAVANNNVDPPILFFWASESSGMASRVRTFTNLGEPTPEPVVVILDMPDDGGFYLLKDKVSKESMGKFASEYLGGALKSQRQDSNI
eukprot:c1748_g1_i1.p1 GENE.c1748_g1_i1~~c1748_g1_i1.p1  ORF type:complete len:290 (+),score=74.02 c1748_g1_i1:38-871(+)